MPAIEVEVVTMRGLPLAAGGYDRRNQWNARELAEIRSLQVQAELLASVADEGIAELMADAAAGGRDDDDRRTRGIRLGGLNHVRRQCRQCRQVLLGSRRRIGCVEGGQGIVLQERVGLRSRGVRMRWRDVRHDRRPAETVDDRATATVGLVVADIPAVRHLPIGRESGDEQRSQKG